MANLNNISEVPQIIIAIGAIASIWFARKALKESGWSLAMTTAPSVIVKVYGIDAWEGKPDEFGSQKRITAGKDIPRESEPNPSVQISFQCTNLGRGVALNFMKPKITGGAIYTGMFYPFHLAINDFFNVTLTIQKPYNEWLSLVNKEIPIQLEIFYTNDQQNIKCISSWSGRIKPFETNNGNLILRTGNIITYVTGGVRYSKV